MKRITLALVSDCLFSMLCAFFVGLAVIRFYVRNVALSICLSVMVALAAGILCLLFLLRRREKLCESTASTKALERLSLYLAITSDESCAKLLADALNGTYMGGNCLSTPDGNACALFRAEPVGADEIALMLRRGQPKISAVYLNFVSPEAERLCDLFGIKINRVGKVMELLKSTDNLPDISLPEEKKRGILKRIKSRFTRRLFPSLFFSGLALLAFSAFTFYPVYYVVFGSALMLLSALCLLFNQSS